MIISSMKHTLIPIGNHAGRACVQLFDSDKTLDTKSDFLKGVKIPVDRKLFVHSERSVIGLCETLYQLGLEENPLHVLTNQAEKLDDYFQPDFLSMIVPMNAVENKMLSSGLRDNLIQAQEWIIPVGMKYRIADFWDLLHPIHIDQSVWLVPIHGSDLDRITWADIRTWVVNHASVDFRACHQYAQSRLELRRDCH